jgi:hypothetical protein
VAKEKARHLFLQIDVSYIIVIFWEGAGMTKTHRKAHAAPPAAPARLRSTARPPGVATRVALADVDETRCCSSMDGDGPRSCSRSSRRHDDLEVRRRTSTPRQGLRHKRPRREDRGLQNQVLETPGLLCPREDSRGVRPAARRGASSHSSVPRRLESARGHNLAATSTRSSRSSRGTRLAAAPDGRAWHAGDFQDLLSPAASYSLAMMAFAGMTFMPTAVIGMFFHTAFPLYVFVNVIDERDRHADALWLLGPGRLRRDQRRAAEHLSSSYDNQRRVSTAKDKELLLDMIFYKVPQD